MMMKYFLISILLISSYTTLAQENETIVKEKGDVKEKRQKRNKSRQINYNATSTWDAIRPLIGAGAIMKDNKVLFNTVTLFASGSNYVLWVVKGVIVGEEIPNNLNIYEIANVNVLRSPMDTEKYGFRGSAGVIEITLKE
jgi:hypothetical protein